MTFDGRENIDLVDESLFSHEMLTKKNLLSGIDLVDELLFSWIKPGFSSSIDLVDSFKGDGIVICVFDRYIDMAIINLLIIREFHKSTLPIEIFYMGEEDLSAKNRERLESSKCCTCSFF